MSNKIVYRKSKARNDFYKIIATDSMITVQINDKNHSIGHTSNICAISYSFDDDHTDECNATDFNNAFAKALENITLAYA